MGKTYKISCAGFGGQGVMSMGQLLTYAGMEEGKEVSWVPHTVLKCVEVRLTVL